MTQEPLISVIIPCYNYATYISEAIESIRAQTYSNWEIIVVDDGSTDNTADVVAEYVLLDPNRIKYYYQVNQGPSVARNIGIALTQGEYIQLLDADDYIANTKFEIQVSLLAANPDASLLYGDTYNFMHSPNNLSRVFTKFMLRMAPVSGQGRDLALHMAYDNIFLIGSPLFKRSMALSAGQFNHTIFTFEDWNFWYKAVLEGVRFIYDNRAGTEFYVRTHGNNTTGNQYKMWKYKIYARQEIINALYAAQESNIIYSPDMQTVLNKNLELLYEERARFNLLYGKVYDGLNNAFQYFLCGKKKVGIWYDSAYWLKERLLGRNQINL